MVSVIFPRTTKIAAFPTSGGVFPYTYNSTTLKALSQNCETQQFYHGRSSILGLTYIVFLVSSKDRYNVTIHVCAVPAWYNYQLSQLVHEFVEPVAAIQTNDMDHRRFAISLTPSWNSQNRSHPACILKNLRFALQLYGLFSSINTVFKCTVCTAFSAVENVAKCDN
jgi:hypothetical protein